MVASKTSSPKKMSRTSSPKKMSRTSSPKKMTKTSSPKKMSSSKSLTPSQKTALKIALGFGAGAAAGAVGYKARTMYGNRLLGMEGVPERKTMKDFIKSDTEKVKSGFS
jgi:hypothetical protein